MNLPVSIIIPVYNVSLFIEKCVVSLYEQTFPDIEYIFVDDKSPDDSINKLKLLMEQYPERAKHTKILFHQQNKGLASARKTGLLAASGEYILNFDSDDYLDLEAVEIMYNKAVKENADIVIADFWIAWRKVKKYFSQKYSSNKIEYTNYLLSGETLPGVVNKLIKKKLYIDNDIYPIDSINLGEDFITTPRLAYYANKIVKIDKALVYYVQYNNSSYTKNMSETSANNLIFVLNYLNDFFAKQPNGELFRASLLRGQLMKKINLVMDVRKDQRRKMFKLFPESNKSEFVNSLSRPEKIVYNLCKSEKYFMLDIFVKSYKLFIESIQILKGRRF